MSVFATVSAKKNLYLEQADERKAIVSYCDEVKKEEEDESEVNYLR